MKTTSHTQPETAWQRYIRRAVSAQFKAGEYVNIPSSRLWTKGSYAHEYVRHSKIERFFDRAWGLFTVSLLWFMGLGCSAALLNVHGTYIKGVAGNLGLFFCLAIFALPGLYFAPIFTGGLRWMHRHRHDPRTI